MTPALPTAVLFDMDDTVVAFDTVGDRVWESLCNACAPTIDGVTPERMLAAVQAERRWYWSDPVRHRIGRMDFDKSRLDVVTGALSRLGVESPALARELADAYEAQRDEGIRPFDGALETLSELKARGVRLGLVTNGNGPYQRRKVERFGLARYFDGVLIEGEFGLGKPDERVYRHALAELGAEPTEAWMVGDNLEWEVAAPQRLGMYGVWVDSKRTGLPSSTTVRPDRIILSLPELLEGLP